jgi:hypothetical protein
LSNLLCDRSLYGNGQAHQNSECTFTMSGMLVTGLTKINPPASACSFAISVAGPVPRECPSRMMSKYVLQKGRVSVKFPAARLPAIGSPD